MSNYYEVDEKDERLTDIEKQGNEMLSGNESDMDKAMDANKSALDGINAKLEQGQAKLEASANEQTEFAIDEIERQKAQAQKDYTKEQSAAYKDWQTAKDPYGVNAEKMAGAGLDNSGYAESSKVSMYNQYQARVTAARESFQRSIDNYNASITQARLQNNATLAQIAYETLVKQAEYAATFAMKNTELLTQLAGQKVAIKQQNIQNWQSVYQQLIQEAQYNATMAENKRQHDETLAENQRQFDANMAFQRELKAAQSSGGGGGGSSSIKKSSSKSSGRGGSGVNSKANVSAVNKDDTGGKKTTSKEKDLPIDYKSLVRNGLAGKSAKTIDEMVRNGQLAEYVEDGMIKYRLVFSGRGRNIGHKATNKLTHKNK